jgi:AmmeMemoRadiSam system protein B
MAEEYPRLRHIEAFPVQQGNQHVLCLRDPLRFTDQILTVSPAAVPILQRLDGKHSLRDIQTAFYRATQQVLPMEQLESFVGKLDEALMLASERFRTHQDNVVRAFRESPLREPSHAGGAYPASRAGIERMFARHFEPPKGPGRPAGKRRKLPAAIVSPHIDLRRGGPGFAWAYRQLLDTPKADTFVILGVAHSPTTHRFAGTKKAFRTPLGAARNDHAFMDALAAKLPFDLYRDEFAHRSEHSIEFQVVYLQHLFGDAFQIAPILVGSFHDLLDSDRPPIEDGEVAAFASALRETIAESDKRICVVAGVDLAHVGGRFGDEFTVNEGVRAQLESDDREMLKLLEACDATGFFRMIHEEQDARRVCGFPTLYTMLSALEVKQGKLLYYDQSFEKDTNSVVSFASMSFH